MSIPVYLFLFTYIPMLIFGVIRSFTQGPVSLASTAPGSVEPLTLLLVLHAFSAGCTALTGIEAISNGVPAFKSPESKNAQKTLAVMAILMGILFIGSIGFTHYFAVIAAPKETILSALARYLAGKWSGVCINPDHNPADPGCRCQYQFCRISSYLRYPGWRKIPSAPTDHAGRPSRLCKRYHRLIRRHSGLNLCSLTAIRTPWCRCSLSVLFWPLPYRKRAW